MKKAFKYIISLILIVFGTAFLIGKNIVKASAEYNFVDNGVMCQIFSPANNLPDAEIRSNSWEMTITDQSQFNNPCDNIDSGQTLANYCAQGYITLAVSLTMDIKEVDDGYQEIFFYNSTSSSATNLVTPIESLEHGGNKKNTTYKTYNFYAEINIYQMTSNRLVIRYGAHGALGDTWKNKHVTMRIGLSTSPRVFTSLTLAI
jgi:hypothetical protein